MTRRRLCKPNASYSIGKWLDMSDNDIVAHAGMQPLDFRPAVRQEGKAWLQLVLMLTIRSRKYRDVADADWTERSCLAMPPYQS